MALSISPNPFSITSELGTTQDITVSGLSYYNDGTNSYTRLYVKVRGVTVKTITAYPTVDSYTFLNIDFNVVRDAIYSAAQGNSLTGAVTVEVVNVRISPAAQVSATTSAGNLTIAGRLSAFNITKPTTAAPINLDAATLVKLEASWTRPHSAFYGRLRLYVGDKGDGSSVIANSTLIFNRYGFGTSTSIDLRNVAGNDYTAAIIAAMNSASPKDILMTITTQFDDGTADLIDLGSAIEDKVAGGFSKSFYDGSRVYLNQGGSYIAHRSYVKTAGVWVETPVYVRVAGVWEESL